MIVCSCNVLSDKEILNRIGADARNSPSSVTKAFKCLGCAPRCGRCLITIKKLLSEAERVHCDPPSLRGHPRRMAS